MKKSFWWWLAVALLLPGYYAVRHYYGNVGAITAALLDPGCPGDTRALTAPTLSEMYDHSSSIARQWKPDAVLVRMDNLAMEGPLQPNGSSTNWTAGFYSADNKSNMLIHTGDGKIYCSHNNGEPGGVPALKADFMRDGAALYAMAEKNGRPPVAKPGLGMGLYLWSNSEGRTSWMLQYVDRAGYPAGPTVVVDPNTGKLEEVRK